MAHPNEESLRRGYDAFGRGDVEAVLALFTDDIRLHIPGRNPVSGEYQGKDQVVGFFTKLMELTDGTFSLDVHDVLANDEHAVGLVTLRGERGGRTLDVNDAQVWHVKDGKFSEFWSQLFDLYAADEFWS
jgi:ketosteroid isomerase-like protein